MRRFDVHRTQSSAKLLALDESGGPILVVATGVKANALAGEQSLGDHGDGELERGFQRAFGADNWKFYRRFVHGHPLIERLS
jgi:hypothetical protein